MEQPGDERHLLPDPWRVGRIGVDMRIVCACGRTINFPAERIVERFKGRWRDREQDDPRCRGCGRRACFCIGNPGVAAVAAQQTPRFGVIPLRTWRNPVCWSYVGERRMNTFKEIEETQVALDQAYAKLVAMRQSHDVDDLGEVHGRAEEALAGARARSADARRAGREKKP